MGRTGGPGGERKGEQEDPGESRGKQEDPGESGRAYRRTRGRCAGRRESRGNQEGPGEDRAQKGEQG